MDAIFQAEHFELHGLSVPYLAAALGLFAIGGYALFVNGLRVLRASFLVCCFALALVTACYGLIASCSDRAVAEVLHRWAASLIPVVAAGIFAFVTVHLEQHIRRARLVVLALGVAILQIPLVVSTHWYIEDVRQAQFSLGGHEIFHLTAGPLLPVLFISGFVWLVAGGVLVYRELGAAESNARKRHLRRLLLALGVFSLSAVDLLVAYGVMDVPLSWLFAGIGTLFLFRVLIADELIHARALDYQVPLIAFYTAACALLLGAVWYLAKDSSPAVVASLALGMFLALRIGLAMRDPERLEHHVAADTPSERRVEAYIASLEDRYTEERIAEATSEALMAGLECGFVEIFLLSVNEWAWTTVDGEVLPEASTPDPLVGSWLIETAQPVQRHELDSLDLEDFIREPVDQIMAANQADILVPLINGDELLGVVIIGRLPDSRLLPRDKMHFLMRVQERLTEALVYSRMRAKANARVAMQQEVAVAAAIQKAFVSRGEQNDFGQVQVSGLWAPATQCGGDWWSVHQVPDGRVLVLIGDVTGHGVAAAMVTAAARGCYDVVQQLMGESLDLETLLGHLDHIVRLVGAGQFNMTCFATLLDPAAGEVHFANAGHVVPYVCSADERGRYSLSALVARGNPLGAGEEPFYQRRVQKLDKGDFLVWYTDGIVESSNTEHEQFGDRRLQRLLRKVDFGQMSARNVRDHIIRKLATFQNGHPADDDITLVIARIM